jgi:hypothetical protein
MGAARKDPADADSSNKVPANGSSAAARKSGGGGAKRSSSSTATSSSGPPTSAAALLVFLVWYSVLVRSIWMCGVKAVQLNDRQGMGASGVACWMLCNDGDHAG